MPAQVIVHYEVAHCLQSYIYLDFVCKSKGQDQHLVQHKVPPQLFHSFVELADYCCEKFSMSLILNKLE